VEPPIEVMRSAVPQGKPPRTVGRGNVSFQIVLTVRRQRERKARLRHVVAFRRGEEEKEENLRKCFKCGHISVGFGKPRPRQICENCGAYLHICLNCHHFDRKLTNSCKLPDTKYVGPRDLLNYCEQFEMVNSELKAVEARFERARTTWENLFRR